MFDFYLSVITGFIWDKVVIVLCLTAGIVLTLRLKFAPFFSLPHAINLLRGKHDHDKEEGEISHFQALSAALSGTIGLGNIAGVAIAIGIGGPGAVFWMWLTGLLGMTTKYVECTLGTYFREKDKESEHVYGGPMYYIEKGLGKKWKPLAVISGVLLMLGSLGIGNVFQANQATQALQKSFHIPALFSGIVLSIITGFVIIGGIQRIAKVASKIVPLMCLVYLLITLAICVGNYELIPYIFKLIIEDAFTGHAAAGGIVTTVIFWGIRRAVFSNEAGLGSAPIAHAAVRTNYPIREGIVAALGPLIDTLILCTATALIIILSGNYGSEIYEPSKNAISYPQSKKLPLNWTYIKQPIEIPNGKLQKLTTGKEVIHYSSYGNLTPYSLKLSSLIKNSSESIDGIRYSYYLKSGELLITIHNLEGTVLESKTQKIVYTKLDRYWKSKVLQLSQSSKDYLKNNSLDSIFVTFTPKSADAVGYLDRLEAVKRLEGIHLTTKAYDKYIKGFGSIFITIAVLLFAFSTMITWAYYGEVATRYSLGSKFVLGYKLIFIGMIVIGSVTQLSTIINFSDLFIGLMVIPNFIAIILLSGTVKQLTTDYFKKFK